MFKTSRMAYMSVSVHMYMCICIYLFTVYMLKFLVDDVMLK